jgi:hypothetical protein
MAFYVTTQLVMSDKDALDSPRHSIQCCTQSHVDISRPGLILPSQYLLSPSKGFRPNVTGMGK